MVPDDSGDDAAPVEKQVKMPQAWGATKDSGPKRWSDGARSDDPSVRVIHPPLADGVGTGKAFFFLFGFKKARQIDQEMLARELDKITDDVELLRGAGYTVVVDPQGTRDDFLAAVTGAGEGTAGLVPAGFYWSAHGHQDGAIECCDGAVIRPADVDPAKVSPGLRLAVFGACYVGSRSRTWRKALGGKALVVGWGRPVTIGRAVDFLEPDDATTTDLDDLLRRWMLTDTPVPLDEEATLPAPARTVGRIGDLAARIQKIADMVGGSWHTHDTYLHVEVPLGEERSHLVEVFVVDGTEPFSEGELLFGAEADVGEMTALVTPEKLLGGMARPGLGRIALVKGETDMPRIVTQSFVPLARASDQDLAAHVYQVAARADRLEDELFGIDDA
jgi:hypothetical protein